MATAAAISVQQAEGKAKLIDRDPGPAMIAIKRGDEPHSLALLKERNQSGFSRRALIPVAQQLITVARTTPAHRAHGAVFLHCLRVEGATPKSSGIAKPFNCIIRPISA